MIIRITVALLVSALALWAGAGGRTEAGGQTRYYQAQTPALAIAGIPPYFNSEAVLSFAIDRPGRVVAIHIVPTADIRASMEDRIVGSLWVNASDGPTIDDLFGITADIPAMRLYMLADVGMPNTPDMPVGAGDVVTVLLGDEQSGAPPLPPATWVLEVAE